MMAGDDSRLSAEEHARILREKVLVDASLASRAAHENPTAIILAGQPGAGKGGMTNTARRELGSDVTVVDPDALRDAHPRVAEFQRAHPYTWADDTHADASAWAKELRGTAIEARSNLILDTTLGDGPKAVTLVKDLQARGYNVEVRAIATHRLESELGVDKRFSDKFNVDGYGRYVPESIREQVYRDLPGNLDQVAKETGIPVRIFNREGAELYDSKIDARTPGAALQHARDARLSSPAITQGLRDGWEGQQSWHRNLPETLPRNPLVDATTRDNLFAERREMGIVDSVDRTAREAAHADYVTRVRPEVAKGLGALGVAATAYDAADTLHDVSRLQRQGNGSASEERITRFATQNLGGWGGAAAGAGFGAAAGVETGPGLLVTGAIGGVVGAVAGDKVADWIRDYKINNQSDRNGNTWSFNPDAPSRGWTRREIDFDAMRTSEGVTVYKPRELKADAALSSELTYKASSRSIELALGQPPQGNDPYRLPANAAENAQRTPFETGRAWLRDPGTGRWQQEIRSNPDGRASLTRHEAATPERAHQLDAQSQSVITSNAARTPAAMAAQFQAAYDRNGWSQYGPLPKAVEEAKAHPARIVGSDGNPYDRGADGRWTHDRFLLPDSQADGNLRRELDATFQHQQKTLGIKTLETVQVRPDPRDFDSATNSIANTTPSRIGAPRDALRDSVDAGVRDIDRQVGKPWDQYSGRMSASALMLATKAGFNPGDNVQVSLSTATSEQPAGANLLVMRTGAGASADPAANRAAMPTHDALAMPAEQRLQQVAEIGQQQAAQQQRDVARSQDESTRQVASVGR